MNIGLGGILSPADVFVQCEVLNCAFSFVNSIASENILLMYLFLPEGAVIEGGITPVRDQADGVPRFIHVKENG